MPVKRPREIRMQLSWLPALRGCVRFATRCVANWKCPDQPRKLQIKLAHIAQALNGIANAKVLRQFSRKLLQQTPAILGTFCAMLLLLDNLPTDESVRDV